MSADVLILATALSLAWSDPEPTERDRVEALALKALAGGGLEKLKGLGKTVSEMKPDVRATLRFRLRPDGVEFRFQGEFPSDKLSRDSLEYVLSGPEKDYESLLVIGPGEMARLKAVGDAVAALRKAVKKPVLEYRLAWAEKGRARVEDLRDILGPLTDAEKDAFYEQLEFKETGLGGGRNVKADAAALPSARTAAEVTVIVRLPR